MGHATAPDAGGSRLLIVTNNHFDLTWRRCAWRRFTWNGQTFASYAEAQTWYVEDNLAIAEAHAGYRFDIESPAVVANVLALRSDLRPRLQALADAGRLGVGGTGWCIIDANLVGGETLVRNVTIGQDWLHRTLGLRPRLANRSDAFGNACQLPQILRGCGFMAVGGLSYSLCRGRWWRGLDGTAIAVLDPPVAAYGGHWGKLRPCPACAGAGCSTCANRGVDPTTAVARLPGVPSAEVLRRHPTAVVRVSPEEQLPNPGIVAWADQHGATFACEEDLLRLVPDGEAHPGVTHTGLELNPNNSGCWTTRIRLKQRMRANEDAVRAAETWSALVGRADPELDGLWQDLCFAGFHDAVTGTLVDAGADELEAVHDRIAVGATAVLRRALAGGSGDGATVANHLGYAANVIVPLPAGMVGAVDATGNAVPVIPGDNGAQAVIRVPALSSTHLVPASAPAIRQLPMHGIASDRFRIELDDAGITAINDLRLGRPLSVRHAGINPAHLLIESDHGSPWATLTPPGDPVALGLQPIACEAGPGWQRLRLRTTNAWGRCVGAAAELGHVAATITMLVIDGHDRIEIATTVDWDTHDLRLRLAFPLTANGEAWYGVPYGMIARPSYVPTWGWAGADGDWPALGWAGVQANGLSVAVLERGTPAFRIRERMLSVSLLRAPTQPTYLHEPISYRMTAWDGMRDAGQHVLYHAVVAYDRPFADSSVVADAEAFSAKPTVLPGRVALPAAPQLIGEGVRLGALWRTGAGAVALRLVETRGRHTRAILNVPWSGTARRTAMDAAGGDPIPRVDGSVAVDLRPWEIATVAFDGGG